MQELRQKYQRDHRERQGRYVDDDAIDDEYTRDEDVRSCDREDEGYADGSPISPRVSKRIIMLRFRPFSTLRTSWFDYFSIIMSLILKH